MLIILGRRHRLLHVRALLANWHGGEQQICPVHHGSPLDFKLLHKERATPRAPLREEARRSRVLHRELAPEEEMQEEEFIGIHDRFIRDRNNWWIRSNTVGSDTMPVRHRADFKQSLSTLRQLKHQEDTAHQQRWKNWQESWWHSSYEHHHEDGPSPD